MRTSERDYSEKNPEPGWEGEAGTMGGSYLSRRKLIFFWFPVALAVAVSIEYAPLTRPPMLGTSGLALVLNPVFNPLWPLSWGS